MSIFCLVEGQGDEAAVPALVRRVGGGVIGSARVHAGKIFAGNWCEVDSRAELARRKDASGLLLVLDTDCELKRCPKSVAPVILTNLRAHAAGLRASLVLAECEFESWLLQGAEGLRGIHGLPADLSAPAEAGTKRDAKGWLSKRMDCGYRATLHQAELARHMDIVGAKRNSRSFRKFCVAVAYLTA